MVSIKAREAGPSLSIWQFRETSLMFEFLKFRFRFRNRQPLVTRKEARSQILRLNYNLFLSVRHGREYRNVRGIRFVPAMRGGFVDGERMVASINIYFGRVLLFCFLWLILACRFVILFFFFFRFFFGIIKIDSLNHRVFSICLHGL